MSDASGTFADTTERLTEAYRRRCTGLDEMLGANGKPRSAWKAFGERLDLVGLDEMRRRQREIKRRLREDGATYHVYGNPQGPEHPWALDALPLLIDAPQWLRVSKGLEQRAHLLGLLLADLYGPQRALHDGLIPPAAVLDHPGFLRMLVGTSLPKPQPLPLYAADLARGPDERLWLLSDRVQAPSGLGYALENRRVMAETQPRLYRDLQVAGLGGFLSTFEQSLRALAGDAYESLGLLTPGPYNETFFDQALLAAHLGIPLLQGDDLNASGGSLRMPRGAPLHVLLRRLDADWCDPLELRPDSLLGVPGMLELVRRGRLTLINPPGCGVLENFALIPFLPALSRTWLGEELLLPQVATWWCGQPKALEHVLARLDSLVVRPIARQLGPAVFPGSLDRSARERLAERIRAQPGRWIGQAPAVHSTAPVLQDDGLAPRAVVLRSFAAAGDEGYAVLPGALVRTSVHAGDPDTRGRQGGPSKDLWVPAGDTAAQAPWLRSPHRARATPIPPHAADNLFWTGRYMARAEALGRSLRAWSWRVDGTDSAVLRTRLLDTLAVLAGMPAVPRLHPHAALVEFITGSAGTGGLSVHLNHLETCLGSIRERLPADAPALNRQLRPSTGHDGSQALLGLERQLTALWALEGIFSEGIMPHDGGAFFACGLRLERALSLVTLLNHTLIGTLPDPQSEDALAEAALAAVGGTETHRRSHGWPPEAAGVLDLLIREPDFARSLSYQLEALERAARRLPGLPIATRIDWADRVRAIAAPLVAQRLSQPDGAGRLLQTIDANLRALADELTTYYFPPAPQLRIHRTL
jgi:uncharacterized circularly permuted ATP-grasp superfamily protein/uncharacterized alpha-E superfamily protein